MDEFKYEKYLEILREELVTALGCTEPIAIAYAAAAARNVLGVFPSRINISCSGNIIKNVKSVVVPNTGGLKGIEASALAGVVGGNTQYGMEVLSQLTEQHAVKISELLEKDICRVGPGALQPADYPPKDADWQALGLLRGRKRFQRQRGGHHLPGRRKPGTD